MSPTRLAYAIRAAAHYYLFQLSAVRDAISRHMEAQGRQRHGQRCATLAHERFSGALPAELLAAFIFTLLITHRYAAQDVERDAIEAATNFA